MKYYVRKAFGVLEGTFIHQFKGTRSSENEWRWGFRNPMSMLNSRVIWSLNGKNWPFKTKVIPGDLVLDSEYELIKEIFEKGVM